MQISYVVNGVSDQSSPATVEVNGAMLSAIIPDIEVELVDPLNQHGSLNLHFRTPEEKDYALATFTPGATVSITL